MRFKNLLRTKLQGNRRLQGNRNLQNTTEQSCGMKPGEMRRSGISGKRDASYLPGSSTSMFKYGSTSAR
jgi:hypothetical protein